VFGIFANQIVVYQLLHRGHRGERRATKKRARKLCVDKFDYINYKHLKLLALVICQEIQPFVEASVEVAVVG
jgi:hypothetical protein